MLRGVLLSPMAMPWTECRHGGDVTDAAMERADEDYAARRSVSTGNSRSPSTRVIASRGRRGTAGARMSIPKWTSSGVR